MRIKFLLDENVPARIQSGLLRYSTDIDVIRVGQSGAPERWTSDPDILGYLEEAQRALLTYDRRSMPGHVAAHLRIGHHHWGIFRIRTGTLVGNLIDEASLHWEVSDAEEWIDFLGWIPFT